MLNRRTLLKSLAVLFVPVGTVFADLVDGMNVDERKIVDVLLPHKQYKPKINLIWISDKSCDYRFLWFDPTKPGEIYHLKGSSSLFKYVTFPSEEFLIVKCSRDNNINWDKVNKSLGYECKILS